MVDQQTFKVAMSQVAAAVAIVTTGTQASAHGTTVSAFMSLSLEPPMVLVSLDQKSSLLARLEIGLPIGINVLSTEQNELARRFADKLEDRFAGWIGALPTAHRNLPATTPGSPATLAASSKQGTTSSSWLTSLPPKLPQTARCCTGNASLAPTGQSNPERYRPNP